MNSFFPKKGIKNILALVFMILSFTSAFSQNAKVKREVEEAINEAKTGDFEKAIPVLKKYSVSKELDDFTLLETNVFLSFCYLATGDGEIDINAINILTDNYLEKHGISKSDSLQREKELSSLFFIGAFNSSFENYRKMLSYLLLVKEKLNGRWENDPDELSTELFKLLSRGYFYLEDFQSSIEYGHIAYKLNYAFWGEKNKHLLEVLELLYSSYKSSNELDKALKFLLEEIEIGKEVLGEDHPDYLVSSLNLADLYADIFDFQNAFKINQQILEPTKRIFGEEHHLYLYALNSLAYYYSNLGNYQKALETSLKVVELGKTVFGEKNQDYLIILNDLATYYSDLGNYQSALEIGIKVVELSGEVFGKESLNYLISQTYLLQYYSNLGDFHSAFELTQKLEEKPNFSIEKNKSKYSLILGNLASNYKDLGDFQKALEIENKVIQISRELYNENDQNFYTILSNNAFTLLETGDYQSALEINQEIVEKSEKSLGKSHPLHLTFLGNLALNLSYIGDFEQSLKLNQEVAKLRKEVLGEDHPDYFRSLLAIASNYSNIGDHRKSLKINHEVVKFRKEKLGNQHPDYILSLSNLALSEYELGKNNTALSHFVESLSLSRERSIAYFGQLTEHQRENFWNENNSSFNSFPLFLENAPHVTPVEIGFAYDIALFTKGLLLNTTLDFDQLITENGSFDAVEKYQDLKLLKLQIQRLYERPISERYLDVDSLVTVAQRLETDLVKISKEYGDYTQNLKIDWKDVQAKLGQNDLAIEFLEYPTLTDTVKYAALLLRKGWENPKFVPLSRKDQVDEFLNLDKNQIYSFGTVGKELKKLVWGPLEEYVLPGDRVYFSASGIIHQLAIENLAYDDSTTLGDQYQMFRLSSTKELVLQKEYKASSTVALYGGIKYDLEIDQMMAESEKYLEKDSYYAIRGTQQDSVLRKGWQFLPGTLAEAEEISGILTDNHYQVGKYLGEIGSEESFKALSGKKTGIIHIATHGFFLPIEISRKNRFLQMRMEGQVENSGYIDPMLRAGLMLAGGNRAWQGDTIPDTIEDGILTAKEISHLDLRETDLVVLSACETGLGDVSSEGVFGLQRAFKQAGAQSIIMSLWNVKDEATQLLMTNFYENLMKGSSKREAFILARNQCKERYPDPAYWAAFIMLD